MDQAAMMELIKSLRKDATTAGITLGTGLNFYHLEPQAKSIYPVFYPLLASIPRVTGSFAGMVVGGDGVHWKAITSIDAGGYPATSEGNRNQVMQFTEKDYFSAFKFLGKETQVSFPAAQAGLGFEDNIGKAQLSMLNAMLNDEERMILFGNSGSGGNGFQLGTAPTPVAVLATGGAITSTTTVSFRVIALTGWGVFMQPGANTTPGKPGGTAIVGVQPPFTRTNADGSQDLINGGTSAVSAASNVVTTTGSTLAVTGTCAPVPGALGYAWYVDSTDASAPSAANAVFAVVTSAPTVTITALPTSTNQKANATGLSTDNSANALDFDGLLTWLFNYAPATSGAQTFGNSYWKDLNGANLTANGDGTIAEFETVLDFLWQYYKITVDRIWLGGTLIDSVSKKIVGAGVSNAATRLFFETDGAGRLVGGTFAVAYRSKYGPGTVKQLDVLTHPWLPNGVVYFELINNPYPAAGDAIPAVRRIATLEDHFSIKWPYRRLQHEVGVYCFPTLQNYIPFAGAILTGVGSG